MEDVSLHPKEGFRFFLLAAEQRSPFAQDRVAHHYEMGYGVPKDEIEALAWYYIAAISHAAGEYIDRDRLEKTLGRQLALLAQQRSKEILAGIESKAKPSQRNAPPNGTPSSPENAPKASGTGAIVSTDGYVLTAAHVVAEANGLKVVTAHGTKMAKVLRVDEANDIAVLKIADGKFTALPMAPSRAVRLGQSVATIGFPNISIQGFSPKVTKGEISSLNGVADDPRSWQVSVPVQPGNSGGPLLDESGNVVGVIVSKLGAKAAKATGDIPQNVNYAVKSTYALALLEPYLGENAPKPVTSKPKFEDMVGKAQQSVVLILVY